MKLILDVYRDDKLLLRWEQSNKESYVVGRGESDIPVNDPECSRSHALFCTDPSGQLCILDLGSSNGTFVYGQSVQSARVEIGARIRIGQCELVVVGFDPINGVSHPVKESSGDLVLRGWPDAFVALSKQELENFIEFFDSKDIKISARLQDIAEKKNNKK